MGLHCQDWSWWDVDCLKSYLVAKGYTLIFGLDYDDTFSPVTKIASICLFLAMTAIHHWSLHQLDIKNVFVRGELHEEVYMKPPPWFTSQGSPNLVCWLLTSLYGLKESPRALFGRFSYGIHQYIMIRCEVQHSSHGLCIYLVVYVDDIAIIGNDQAGIQHLKQHSSDHFQTRDLGPIKYCLGIEVGQSNIGVAIT